MRTDSLIPVQICVCDIKPQSSTFTTRWWCCITESVQCPIDDMEIRHNIIFLN
uniref:Uncharacterized protein n=1 Tax=Anguilla anguilla TaxID=7936 RepID=A0A0E9WLA1_ANGAN